jgi:phosphonate transport system substrate-binding protein
MLLFVTLTGAACTGEKPEPQPAEEEYAQSLVIGLIPEHNIFDQMERYKPLASYLSRKIGMGIELKILSRYGNIINNFNTLQLDGAFFGSFTYALAHTRLAVETVARPESPQGVSTYYGMIFVRKDSGISTAAQMKGKRFAFVDKATTAGYLLPLKYFRENGIQDYETFFSETYFTGTHEDAILDVLNGKADIGAAKNTVYYRLAGTDERVLNELDILDRSPDVPENALALRSDLDNTLKKRIREALLGMDQDSEGMQVLKGFGQARFIETTNQDYDAVFEYAEAGGIDLATYDWMND